MDTHLHPATGSADREISSADEGYVVGLGEVIDFDELLAGLQLRKLSREIYGTEMEYVPR